MDQTTTKATGASIRIAEISKRYGSEDVLDKVRLDIDSGEFLTLLGASGSGKSTLLNIVAGFTKPSHGSVEIDGHDLTRVPPHKRDLGMVFQNYALFPHLTVAANVAFPLKRHKVPRSQIKGKVEDALALVRLTELGDRKPDQLSGGQQQRVALARALVFGPRVLLMDEPLGALDKVLREQLQDEIRRLHRELGITVVFVTHDQDEALALSDRIALLRKGSIVQVGTPSELYDKPSCQYTAEFVGASNIFNGSVRDGGFREERTGAFLRLPGGARSDCTSILVRPEHLSVASRSDQVDPGHDRITATVEDCVYLGSSRTVHARTADGIVLTSRTGIPRNPDSMEPGARVELYWSVEDVRVLGPDPHQTPSPVDELQRTHS